MSAILQEPNLTSYQKAIIDSKARFTVTEAATKAGKTFSHLWWLTQLAHTPPKDNANYWWIAPVYSQAKIAFSRLRNQPIIREAGYKVNETGLFIQTPNRKSIIHFKSADNPDNLYGEDVYGAVFDEFTRAKEAAWIALRTTLTATKAPCKFIGNVKGKKNWGYKLGLKAKSGEPGYEYFKITANDAVREGILTQDEIDSARRDLPEYAFKELYMAEALDDQANPFGIDFIHRQTQPIKSDKKPVAYGVDLAKSIDWTVVTGIDSDGKISTFERWQTDWSQTKARIRQIVGSGRGYIDATGVGDPIAEEIIKDCGGLERFIFTQSSKQQIMEGLASGIQQGKVCVLDGVMKDEMESFEFEYSRNGVKYRAPEGLHDDCVCSLALAYHKFKNKTSQYFPKSY